jgi:hypothetical protein
MFTTDSLPRVASVAGATSAGGAPNDDIKPEPGDPGEKGGQAPQQPQPTPEEDDDDPE